MSPSYLHRERVLFTESTMLAPPCFYSSPERTNQTLALERAFYVFFVTEGHRSSLTRLWNCGNVSRRVQNRGTASRRLTSVAPKVVLLWYGWPLSEANSVTTVLHSGSRYRSLGKGGVSGGVLSWLQSATTLLDAAQILHTVSLNIIKLL